MNYRKVVAYGVFALFLLVLFAFTPQKGLLGVSQTFEQNRLKGKIICLDPGHGGTSKTDSYRQGKAGEREEWVNLRVALLLKELLEAKGAKVLMTRTTDTMVSLAERSEIAKRGRADVFISIHHNATADTTVNFPIIYFHGKASENRAGAALGNALAKAFTKYFYQAKTPASVVSDHTIFPAAGASVLRASYGIPGVLAEASFFTNPSEELRLKQREHNFHEALAYVHALDNFFSAGRLSIHPIDSSKLLEPFKVFQEAERMNKIALQWKSDYEEGLELMQNRDTASLRKAYDLFTRSARSFPDSYVAGQCHLNRSKILKRLGESEASRQEEKRFREFYDKNR